MNEERRRYDRIYCYLIARRAARGGEELDFFGHVRNLSEGGAMIETELSVAVDSRLNLTFIQDEARQIWEGTGRVVWVRTQGAKVFLGIHFDHPMARSVIAALR
jgi:hypothetical protein